jgi:hypothetical protein
MGCATVFVPLAPVWSLPTLFEEEEARRLDLNQFPPLLPMFV